MKKFKIQLTLILFIICQLIYGQGKTVEDYTLGKKINVSNNYNVGKLGLSVPLYNINLGALSLTGTVDYQQEIPKTEASIVGTNWNYNMFGKITVAYKRPGDLHAPQLLGAGRPSGFAAKSQDNCLISTPGNGATKKQLLDNPHTNNNFYTYEPNTFYFDFLGYSGYMVYDNVGQFLVYSENGNLKANFNGTKCHNIFQSINSFPEIIMKDDKGNEFYFGGDYNSTDIYYGKANYTYSAFVDDGTFTHFTDFYTNRQINYISAFYLKRAKLADGRIIDAFYRNSNKSILDPFTNGGEYINGDYPSGIPSNNILLNNNIFLGEGNGRDFNNTSQTLSNNSGSTAITTVNIYQKISVLDSLRISDYGTLNFSYIQKNNTFTKPFLSKVELKNNKKMIKNIVLNYSTLNNRTYLQSINNNDENYGFNYYEDFTNNTSQQDLSGIKYMAGFGGLLKSVTYPTKGKDEFTYEQNNVSKINFFTLSSLSTEGNQFIDKNSRIDGQRLLMIQTIDSNNNPIKTKKYTYLNDDGQSSGILTYNYKASTFMDSFNWFNEGSTTTTSSHKGYYDDYVRYSKVTEEITGKEKNIYYFTDLITNPDSLATKVYSNGGGITAGQLAQARLPLKVNKSNERGKILKIVNHDSNMFAISTKTFKYMNFLKNANPINEISNTCTTCKISDDKYYIEAKASLWSGTPPNMSYTGYYQYQPVLPYLPISVFTEEIIPYQIIDGTYFGGKLIDSEKHLKYNNSYLYWHPYPIETTDYLPYPWVLPNTAPVYMGKLISRTSYPQDLIRSNSACITGNCPADNDQVGGKFSMYKYMTDNNIIMPVIQSVLNDKNKTQLKENIFIKDNSSSNLLKIGKTRGSLLDSNFTLDTPSSAVIEDKEIFQLYDNLGNLLQSTKSDGIPTTIIYGYKQTLPIAEIKGITYSHLMQIFGLPTTSTGYLTLDMVTKSNSDTDSNSEQLLINALDSFRNNTSLSGYQVSTYTYDPLIGVTSATTPSGMREVYLYDTTNRLKEVRQQEKDNAGNTVYKTVKEVKYHYKN